MEYPIYKTNVEMLQKSVDDITHIPQLTKGVESHSDSAYKTDDSTLIIHSTVLLRIS